MEICTSQLGPEAVLEQAEYLVELFREHEVASLSVMYGIGCELSTDALFRYRVVETRELLPHIRQSVGSGIFKPGKSDLFFKDTQDQFKVRLCHESDIHVETQDARFFEKVKSQWKAKGLAAYVRASEQDKWQIIEV